MDGWMVRARERETHTHTGRKRHPEREREREREANTRNMSKMDDNLKDKQRKTTPKTNTQTDTGICKHVDYTLTKTEEVFYLTK